MTAAAVPGQSFACVAAQQQLATSVSNWLAQAPAIRQLICSLTDLLEDFLAQ